MSDKYNIGDLFVSTCGFYQIGYIEEKDSHGDYGIRWKNQENLTWYSPDSLNKITVSLYKYYPVVK